MKARHRWQGLLFIALLSAALSGCGSLLFFPYKTYYLTPHALGLDYRKVALATPDGVKLQAWFVLAETDDVRGTVFFLYGNAENMSTHIRSVYWLASHGYQLFLLDYRGYGASQGEPDLAEVFIDIDTGFQWLIRQPQVQGRPLFLLGQSLGASLAAYYAGSREEVRGRLSAIVLDSPFASYRELTRQKLADFWPTWPLQYPLSWLMPDCYSPIRTIDSISPVPLLIIASDEDKVVPLQQSLKLYQAARPPKRFLRAHGRHIATFNEKKNRQVVLDFFSSASRRPRHKASRAFRAASRTRSGAVPPK